MSIVENRKALHDYFIEERYEAGLALAGWEVKAIRAGRAQLKEAYVIVRNGEVYLTGAHHAAYRGLTRQRGIRLAPESCCFTPKKYGSQGRAFCYTSFRSTFIIQGRVKLNIGLARGKKQYDKRETEKKKEWQREQQRLIKAKR
jgi:SsrA-binding protein